MSTILQLLPRKRGRRMPNDDPVGNLGVGSATKLPLLTSTKESMTTSAESMPHETIVQHSAAAASMNGARHVPGIAPKKSFEELP